MEDNKRSRKSEKTSSSSSFGVDASVKTTAHDSGPLSGGVKCRSHGPESPREIAHRCGFTELEAYLAQHLKWIKEQVKFFFGRILTVYA